jgi:hypothetical protein
LVMRRAGQSGGDQVLLVAGIDCDAKGVCRERGVAGETSLAMGHLAVIWRHLPDWMEGA